MYIRRELAAPCDSARLFAWVEDLDQYPQWMTLVHSIQRVDQPAATPAWNVELRAHVGPFARSKVLRMERTEHVAPTTVPGCATFQRSEVDGREHSPWTLRATVAAGPTDATSHLTMELEYGGSLWGGAVLQRVLDDSVRRASERLVELVSEPPTR